MATITLNSGVTVLVDDIDGDWLSEWSWTESSGRAGQPGYAMRGTMAGGVRRGFYMHREIALRAGILLNVEDRRPIDHINIDHFDNRRANLRATTVSENNGNVRPRCSSGVLGVYPCGSSWSAEVCRNGVRRRGYGFATVAEASAWRALALESLREAA